ncbi:MAG TPA: 16S rRNA (guanine(966)-N(2))-methyltransferase RsmD [Candidatus Acidoferrales bacterium]|nr:16S rRNA (guanine(966)-N(2))-methyltransferase RsmD [Candidatus Acidoferrales bacterium]
MRVIAGKFRSRRLAGPGSLRIRPTSDRLRETLFNVLGPSVADSLFVDLFAGTGAVGIEAISRGAREVVFVESNAKAVGLIRRNLESLQIGSGVELIEAKTERGMEKIAVHRRVADFVFLDPPYEAADEYTNALDYLDSSHILAPYGIVIVEHSRKMSLPLRFTRLERSRLLEQGDASLSFYRLAAAA